MKSRSLFTLIPKLYGSEIIGKVMGIASIGSSFANVALLQHFLEGIVSVIALTLFATMMGAMFLATACYALYVALVNGGVSAEASLLIIAFGFAILTVLFCSLTAWHFKKMKSFPSRNASNDFAPIKKAVSVVHAFVSGFLKRPSRIRHSL